MKLALAIIGSVLSITPTAVYSASNEVKHSSESIPLASSQTLQSWRKVESHKVCMVTDMNFERKQIPVQVKGSTYYGCCEGCKDRLDKDPSVRAAVDPVSGKTVDKAKASIAAGPDGSVAYFENDANLEKFIATKK